MRSLCLLFVTAAALSGCASVRTHQGYLTDPQLVASVQPGVDNRASVERALGRPTFMGQFDNNDWYYVGRELAQVAFGNPKPKEGTMLHVRFDPAGNVATAENLGLTRVVSIHPVGDKTPTLGRNRNFFEDLFGNIGQVGSVGQGGGTADNPTGGSGSN
ncbi:Lipoprotein SmpA/OmlA domain-containing protein [Sphingomonas antarctica]|uniref:outer membrane protein assembly factor BamE n=1 Tax=Sphingomonas antarctica TaxID=2040274 RepID=UPI0039E82AEE